MSAVAVTTVSLPVNRRGVARNVGPDSPFDRWGNCATHNRREYYGANGQRHLRDDEAGDAPFAQSVTDHERELDARVLFAQAGAQAGVS
jgi:hypothetical protein